MAASIRYNGSVGPLYVSAGTVITLTNFDNTGVLGWEWTLLDRPTGSAATIASPNASTTTFTADVAGSYLVRLRTYLDVPRTLIDASARGIVAVRFAVPYDWRKPAAGERTEADTTRGWATAIEEMIDDLRTYVSTPITLQGAYNGGSTVELGGGSIQITQAAAGVFHVTTTGMRVANGDVTNPSVAAISDTNTGFWFTGADQITVTLGGQNRMRFTADSISGMGSGNAYSLQGGNTNSRWTVQGQISTAVDASVTLRNGTSLSATTAIVQRLARIEATINQTSAVGAGYTALEIDVTETAVDTGAKNLISAVVGATSMFQVSNAGNVFARGGTTVSNLGYSFLQDTDTGFFNVAANNIGVVLGGNEQCRFANASFEARASANFTIFHTVSGNGFVIGGRQTTGSGPAVQLSNVIAMSGSSVVQSVVSIIGTWQQTSTAGSTMLDIDATNTTLGSGAHRFIAFKVGGAEIAAITNGATSATQGNFLAGVGAVGTPSLSFAGDPDTGLFNSSANMIDMVCGGTARWRWSTTDLTALQNNARIIQSTANSSLGISTRMTSATTNPGFRFDQVSNDPFSASSGQQRGILANYFVNQTSTAAFTGFEIDVTNTALGSGTQYLFAASVAGTPAAAITNGATAAAQGNLLVGFGAAATPSLSFMGDTDVGFYRPSADTIGLATSGVLRTQFSQLRQDVFGVWSLQQQTSNANLNIVGRISSTAGSVAPAVAISNGISFQGNGNSQTLLRVHATIDQTNAASMRGIAIDLTNTNLGTGAQYFIDFQVASTTVAGITNSATATARGNLHTGDGAAATPAHSFFSDTDTGLYSAAANELGVSVGGTGRFKATTTTIEPITDNVVSLGASGKRWSDVWATTTTIGDLVMRDPNAKRGDTDAAHWLLLEGRDGIYAYNIRTGQKYALAMSEAPMDETDHRRVSAERARWEA